MSTFRSPIIFLDSGIGGLTYLKAIMQKYPGEDYVYIADSVNFPYGEKSARRLRGLLEPLANHLEMVFSPKAVVVACNTATLVAYQLLQDIFSCPVVGVKPILTPQALAECQAPISILATESSIRQIALLDLPKDRQIYFHPAGILVNFVENHWLSSSQEEQKAIIQPFVEEFVAKSIKTVMLSCTHFLYLKDTFKTALPGVLFLDYLSEIESVLLTRIKLNSDPANKCRGKLYQTSPRCVEQYEHLCQNFDLKYVGLLLP